MKQGDIIKLVLDPVRGHEQSGFRPAVVVSNNDYNALTGNRIVCPVTNTEKAYLTHVALAGKCATTGFVMCDQVRLIDVTAAERKAVYVESLPVETLYSILAIVTDLFSVR
ncbi:MAG: type II toxin-antitoxin system PemK/MazF family toxin [Oscillospiraceae bacterium]|jgi:mRNA interferase MazF|nr:type II toxin-antitoxin system PemK/MazF family toxin [Oscillospiraceae bacterium]